jgi:uncharacterized Zn-binding protein involved in type VI secretion
MGQPAAKQGDHVVAVDMHIVMVPAPPGPPVPTALPHLFDGVLNAGLSPNVKIMGRPAATVATAPGVSFQKPPANRATIVLGSGIVRINGRAAARNADKATTCNDPADLPAGTVVAVGTVFIGS